MCVCVSTSGHGIMLQEHFAGPTDHLGRRLMATVIDNETAEKNCSKPGKIGHALFSPLALKEHNLFQ